MAKKITADITESLNPTECPFREFRDNELQPEFWGMGPAAFRASALHFKITAVKPPADHVWVDDQTQPLPRSVRQYLHGWIRAEDLAADRWEAEPVIFDEDAGKMTVMDFQLSHIQVLHRSSFCRKVLSACYLLERVDNFTVEHQWENFAFTLPPEGWRAKCHIYSPGTKSGGGQQHRPGLSKNGCYLVRLFYLGAWRCVWVSDQVPVDATDSPLLPFSPLICNVTTPGKPGGKQIVTTVTASTVQLWPLLICKALLKLAAPDMNSDEDLDSVEDEVMSDFSILHCFTGSMDLDYIIRDFEDLWALLASEVQVFMWDDDDDTLTSTVKSKGAKKTTTKEVTLLRTSFTSLTINDSKNYPPYALPGITPAYEMDLLVRMVRDVPLKKPLPEPEVALWKQYRWVDWARHHGLYEAYDCPRTRFLKVNGLLKLSYAPHLLDVMSTESITMGFREEHDKTFPMKKGVKDTNQSATTPLVAAQQAKDELREWVKFDSVCELFKGINIVYYPSMYQFTSAASCPPIRISKSTVTKPVDIPAPKSSPLYLQIDGPERNVLKISLSALHPRILMNGGVPIVDYIEKSYLLLEKFEWFEDCELPIAKAFIQTRGYDSVEVVFEPGRHICRTISFKIVTGPLILWSEILPTKPRVVADVCVMNIGICTRVMDVCKVFRLWVHSRLSWHVMLLSESTLLLGTRDLISWAAVRECPWAARFLTNLSVAFCNWIRTNRDANVILTDREFYKSYQPDLTWNPNEVGYKKSFVHWMFRQALQSILAKKLPPPDFRNVCVVLRRYFCDPDFGLPKKPKPMMSLRDIALMDPCDCQVPEYEEVDLNEQNVEEEEVSEEKPLVDEVTMAQLLLPVEDPITSQVCELATEELPCGILKEEREKVIRKHEAATVLQAHWRGAWARMCLNRYVTFTADVLKAIMDNAFGNFEALSSLMNEFFAMYPRTKPAYSVASALTGTYGLRQFTGSTPITPKCKWIPYFQGLFYCHKPVNVHFDVQCSLQHSTIGVYDNDTGEQMPQVYNAHITFSFYPNQHGYTVMGHGSLHQPLGINTEVHWQLTVLSSVNEAFHCCDNDPEGCKEQSLTHSHKLHLDELFIPNRRNILGGIQISVQKHETVSFVAAATSPDLEIEVILRSKTNGEVKEIAKCCGKGEVYWPYIRLEPAVNEVSPLRKISMSMANLRTNSRDPQTSTRSLKVTAKLSRITTPTSKGKSIVKPKNQTPDPKIYFIEVVAPKGWPLTLAQWKRVDEIQNSNEFTKTHQEQSKNSQGKEKHPGSGKDKGKEASDTKKSILTSGPQPQPDDAYVVLECATAIGGGAYARRDDERDLELANAIRLWDAKDPKRNVRGAQIRKDFRTEFLEALPLPPSESVHSMIEELLGEENAEEDKKDLQNQQGPTPATESGKMEMTVESEEEAMYLLMPEQLKDKFVPLYFVPFCTKDKDEAESVLVTPDIAEAAKNGRHARIEAALDRMRELQLFNELFVLGRQKRRCQLLEKLFVDSQWNPELNEVLEKRDDTIAREILNRTLSATKKKTDAKKK